MNQCHRGWVRVFLGGPAGTMPDCQRRGRGFCLWVTRAHVPPRRSCTPQLRPGTGKYIYFWNRGHSKPRVAARLYGTNNSQCDTGALDGAPFFIYPHFILGCAGSCCCAGFSLVAVSEDYSLEVEHGLWSAGSKISPWWRIGLVPPWQTRSSQIRDQARVSCLGRQVLYLWATREAPGTALSKAQETKLCSNLRPTFKASTSPSSQPAPPASFIPAEPSGSLPQHLSSGSLCHGQNPAKGFPSGSVVKNLPGLAGDVGSTPRSNLCSRTVMLEKTLESPLGCKESQPVHPKGNLPWIFIGRTDAEAEAPTLWPPDAKNWLTGKAPDAGEDWGQEEKGDNRGWGGWTASPTQWTRIWATSGRQSVKDRGAWRAAVHGVTKSWTWLSDWTTTNLTHPWGCERGRRQDGFHPRLQLSLRAVPVEPLTSTLSEPNISTCMLSRCTRLMCLTPQEAQHGVSLEDSLSRWDGDWGEPAWGVKRAQPTLGDKRPAGRQPPTQRVAWLDWLLGKQGAWAPGLPCSLLLSDSWKPSRILQLATKIVHSVIQDYSL